MLDNKQLRQEINQVAAQLQKRYFTLDVETFCHLESLRKTLTIKKQALQNQRNQQSAMVGKAKQQGESTTSLLIGLKEISNELKATEEAFTTLQKQLNTLLATLPNLPHDSVPTGQDETANQIIRVWGDIPSFTFAPQDHVTLSVARQLMDFDTASRLAGARFVILKGSLARLHRALIQFMLDLHTKQHGYQEVMVPYIVNAESLFGTGQLPKFKEDLFALAGEREQYLISTAEIPVTNLMREQILATHELPLKYVCHSPCFRSEAGSYGKDIRGMLRQHQFEKVELVQIVHPDHSYIALEELTQQAERVLQLLKLPYRVVMLCSGELGFAAAKTYDLEVWLPGQQTYREISSCTNTEAFQARRMKTRYRNQARETEWVHTLNGSGLPIGRTLIAILENYQNATGHIYIPTVLQPYMDYMEII